MKIIVSIKEVPVRDSQLHIAADGRWIEDGDLSYEMNEPDAYALEEALQLKEKHGGEVIALCAGPASAARTIREALAKGADRALHIEEEQISSWNTLGLARLLAKAVAGEKPDLILSDLHMPEMDGYQSIQRMRKDLSLATTPIVVITAEDGPGVEHRVLELGADDYIVKPFDPVVLLSRVQAVFRRLKTVAA